MSETNSDFTTIRRGSRVRHSADGVEGRITWANGVSVKIEWDDGEKVTWKRAVLGDKGLQILDEDQAPEGTGDQAAAEGPVSPLDLRMPPAPFAPATPADEPTVQEVPNADPAAPDAPATPEAIPPAPAERTPETAPAPEAKKRTRKARSAKAKPERFSAIDAAARVLEEAGKPLNCAEMIGLMAAKKYWTSPGGKTPAATLYSAILREMQVKGDDARFVKSGRGMFAIRTHS
jgi:hypothetical protein